ncbi:MAG: class I SAM-dependent methyltransferase [Polyangiaceae bacterium]|nr:class I SAM-dependent methyltransferase [Polyangiaceae bacterium]
MTLDRFQVDASSSLAAAVRSSKPEEAVPVRSSPAASNSRQLESGPAKNFFDAIACRYDRVYALSGRVSRDRTEEALRSIAGKHRVLILGVGSGRELPLVLDAGHDAIGVDLSPAMIALCNRRSRTIPIVETDFWSPLPFDDASFDAALALHGTLAHPPRTTAFSDLARELGRVLRPRGVLVAEVPSATALARMASVPQRVLPEGIRIEMLSRTSFIHHDDALRVSIAGVAYDAEGWRSVLSPIFDVKVEPLGDIEVRIVAINVSPQP